MTSIAYIATASRKFKIKFLPIHIELKELLRNFMLVLFIMNLLFVFTEAALGLQLTKTGPGNAFFGDTITYRYALTNNDGVDLTGIVIHDSQLGSISFGDLTAGSSGQKLVSHVINETNMPKLSNTATAIGNKAGGGTVTSNPSSWAINLGFTGTLDLKKTPSDPPSYLGYPIGHNIVYTFEVTNKNGFAINDLSVDDVLYHPMAVDREVTLDRTTLLPGEKATGTVTYTVVQDDILGSPVDNPDKYPWIIDYASASAYPSWGGTKKVAGISTFTVTVDYSTDSTIAKTATPSEGAPHSRTTFDIIIKNTGTALLNRTELNDTLPKGLTFVSANPAESSVTVNSDSTTTIYWSNLSSSFGRVLNPDETFDVQVVAEFDGTQFGQLVNSATSTGYNLRKETTIETDTETVEAKKQNIVVTKTALPNQGAPGAYINFTLTVTNSGNISLTDVFVQDALPSGLTYFSSWPVGNHVGQNVYWADIGSLDVGASKNLWVNATIDGPVNGIVPLTNNVLVDGKPKYGENVTNTTKTVVRALEAKILVDKTALPTFGSKGTLINFTMNVTNTGDALLQHVYVEDLLPAGLTYDSSSAVSSNTGQNVYWPDIGSLASNEKKQIWLKATIDGTVYDPLTNKVDVSGKPEHGDNVTSHAEATVDAIEAKILVDKTALPTFGSKGTLINFTMNVTNTGDALLQHVYVEDLLPAGLTYDSSSAVSSNTGQNVYWPDIGSLASNEKKQIWLKATIDGTVYDPLTNKVDVSGKPEHGDNVTSHAEATVDAIEAKILVDKTALPTFGSKGTLINFTMNVTNTGDALLEHVYVEDLLPAGLTYDSSSAVSSNSGQNVYWPDIGSLASNEKKQIWLKATISGTVYDTLTNKVDVSGKPEHGDNVTSHNETTVDSIEAKILVDKTALPTFGSKGTLINFTMNVTNTGDALLQHVYVEDLLPAGLTYDSSSAVSSNSGQNVYWPDIGSLASNEKKQIWLKATISGTVYDTLTNKVDVSGKPEHGDNVTSHAEAAVDAIEAKILVDKTALPTFGSKGTLINFTMNVTNTGDALLQHVYVEDLLPAGLTYDSSSAVSSNSGQNVYWPDIGSLASNEKKQIWLKATIDGTVYDPLTNKVDVSGKPEHGDNVTSHAEAAVDAIEAKILVDKTALPTFGSKGTLINFTMNVTNTGDALLQHVYVEDLLPAGLTYDSSSAVSSNTGQNVYWPDIGSLASNEKKQIWLKATIDGTVYDPLTNKVDVSGKPEHGDNVTSHAEAAVDAIEAKILVDKTALPTFGSKGTLINFTMNVTNTGDAPLQHVYVEDLLPAGLTYDSSSAVSSNSGQNVYWPDIGSLASNEKKQIWLKATIDGTVYDPLTNKVDVSGKPEHGDNVTSHAEATVDAIEAKILVDKTALPTFGSKGTLINFTMNVTNTGDAPLQHVYVEDLLPAGLTYDSSSAVSSNTGQNVYWPDIGSLASNEKKQIWLKATIDGTVYDPLTNKVDVSGKPEHGDNVTSHAEAAVDAIEAKILVDKTALPTFGSKGTLINFTMNVTNTGDALLEHVYVEDLLPAGLTYDSSSAVSSNSGQNVYWPDIGSLASNEKKQIWLKATISGTVYDTLTNKVDVSGKPEHGDNVTSHAEAAVDAIEAKILVDKTALPTFGSKGTLINFTMNVTNTGDALLQHVYVEDLLPAGLTYDSSSAVSSNSGQNVYWPDIGSLASNEKKQIWLKATISGTVYDTLTNKVDVSGKPEHGDNVTSHAEAAVDAIEAKILVDKTALPTFGSKGTLINFTMNVTNTGDALLQHVYVEDLLPAGLTYDSSSAVSSNSGQNVYWPDIGSLASNEKKQIWLKATIDGTVYDPLTNKVDVSGKPEHGDNVTSHAEAAVDAIEAKILVDKTALPTFGSKGTLINFTMNVTNTGDALLEHVYVEDLLPAGLTYDSSSAVSSNSGQNVYWPDIGSLASNEKKQIWLKATISGTVYDTLTNKVDVSGKPEHGDNVTSHAEAAVDAIEAKILVDKTALPTFGSKGTLINFTMNVTNTGDALLQHVYVEDLLPAGLTYDSSSAVSSNSGQNVYWPDIGSLASNEKKQIWLKATIDGTVYDPLTNKVDVSGKPEHGDNVTSHAEAAVDAIEAKILVDKTALPTFGSKGTLINFTMNVTNTGDALLQHVYVEDLLPAGLTYDSSSAVSSNTGQNVYWPDIGSLASNEKKQIWLKATIDGTVYDPLTNKVDVSGKPEHGDNVTSHAEAAVDAIEAKILVDKTALPTFGSKGTLINFTMNVTNTGDALLEHVYVEDLLPAGLTYDSSSAVSSNSGQNVYWPDIGSLASNEKKQIWLKATISGTVYDPLTNKVDVSGKPEHGDNVTSHAEAAVDAIEAKILVDKTALPTFGSKGTLINFTMNVTNTGDALLQHVYVEDLLPAGLTYDSSSAVSSNTGQNVYWPDIGSLASNEKKQIWLKATIDGTVYDPLTNKVDVSGKPEHGDNVTSHAEAAVDAIEAKILVDKTALPTFGSKGTLINFTMNVTNTGDAPLQHVYVEDLLPAGLTYDSSSAVSSNTGQNVYWPDIGSLASNEKKQIWLKATISGTVYDPLTNKVDVSGKPEHGDNVTSHAEAAVDAIEAKILVDKTALPTFGSKGTLINFTMNVTNTGDAPLQHVYVEDLLPAGLTYDSSSAVSSNTGQNVYWPDIGSLASNEKKQIWLKATISGTVYDPLTNKVDVSGKPEHGDNVTSHAEATVDAIEAKILVDKTALPTFGSKGTMINFTMNVTNTGDAPLQHVYVEDLLPAGLTYDSSSAVSSNTGQNVYWPDIGSLASNEKKQIWLKATISGTVYDPLTNKVDVSGKPEHGDNVTSHAEATVDAIEAKILVDKTALPTFGSKGTMINFTMNVTNTGDAPLQHVYVEDLLPAGLTYDSSSAVSSNTGQNVYWPDIGSLASNEKKQIWLKATIDGTVYDPLTNKVDVSGKPEHGDNVTSHAEAAVDAIEAKILVDKTALPTFGSKGTLINFTMNVTNTGDALLEHVYVEDLLPAGLTYDSSSAVSSNSGQNVYWPDIGSLASNEKKQIWLKATISGTVYDPLTNKVDVSGKPEHGDNVTSHAEAAVDAIEAKILVDKTALPTFGSKGTLINFTMNVTNTGDALLQHVYVEDLLPAGLTYDSSSAVSSNTGQNVYWPDIGSLASNEKKQIWLKATIDGTVYDPLTNKVDVSGKPEHGDNVTSHAEAAVDAIEAKILVDKTALPTFGSKGTLINFTMNVTNTGDALLQHVYVEDLLPAGLTYDSSSAVSSNSGQNVYWPDIGSLASNEKKQIWLKATIDGTVYDPLTNKVDVSGKPEHGDNVTSHAEATVDAIEAKILVDKTALPTFGSKGTLINFTMNVTNTGDAPLQHVYVEDLLPAGLTYDSSSAVSSNTGQNVYWPDIGSLASNEKKQIWLKATISGTVYDPLTNKVDVSGKPEHGDNVTSHAEAAVDAIEAKISVEKTLTVPPDGKGTAGTALTYSIVVTNNGTIDLDHVFVWDQFDSGLIPTPSAGWRMNGQYMNQSDIGPLAVSQSMTLTFLYGKITSTTTETLDNTVTVDAKPKNGGANVTATDYAPVEVKAPSILVEKNITVPADGEGTNGTPLTFSIEVTNNGNINLAHVFVWDLFDVGLIPTTSSGWSMNGQYMNQSDIGPLAVSQSKTLTLLYGKITSNATETLLNTVTVEASPENGGQNVTYSDNALVSVKEPGISVVKNLISPKGGVGSAGTPLNYSITVENTGTIGLEHVFVSDTFDLGLIPTDSTGWVKNVQNSQNMYISDIGPLSAGQNKTLDPLYGQIVENKDKTLLNTVTVNGKPKNSDTNVTATDDAPVEVKSARINVAKTAYPPEGVPETVINYTIIIKNNGSSDLCHVNLTDVLPDGMQYLNDDHRGVFVEPNVVQWPELDQGNCMAPGDEIVIHMKAEIVGTVIGDLNNNVNVTAIPRGGGTPVKDGSKAEVKADPEPYIITKTSDKKSYRPGEEMTYTIKVCNIMKYQTLEEVVVKDVFQDKKVQIIASYPESVDGQWYFSSIAPMACETITLVAVYPASNMTFDLGKSDVSGSGFVNVHNDLSTGVSPYPVTNCVYVTARIYDTDRQNYTSWDREKCYAVTIQDIGTELQTREHGSGDYESEETTKLIMKNRSIESSKSVSASYRPTAFQLPGDNGISYDSKWTEDSRGINHITGATMHEAYRYATDVDRDTYIKMDENGSEMKINSSFAGQGTIGFIKKASFDSGPKVKPAFEDMQRYNGKFQLNQSFEEYGDNAQTVLSTSGEGFASADRRVSTSQRSYEYGTGTYKSDQHLDTFTNYVSKDIQATHEPTSFNYSPSLKANQDIKWSEGMWSKNGKLAGGDIMAANDSCVPVKKQTGISCPANSSNVPPATLISERYTSLQYIKKSSVALGLNEMKSNATFSGMADYRAKASGAGGSDKVDLEESYVGDYDVSRHILITGSSKYNKPHLTVSKVGHLKNDWVNRVNSTVADYVITLTNDGSKSLGPLYVTDSFPAGTEYVSSSYKPTSVSATAANWTILHLGIGSSLTLSLKLNVTEGVSGSIVNRVSVSAIAGDNIITASNYSTIASDMMPCCLSNSILLDKTGEANTLDPTLVNFTIFVKNHGDRIMAVKLTDELPGGMSFLRASQEPDRYDPTYISWVLPNLKPNEEVNITYSARASSNGAYTNKVHMEASAADGSGEETADASAVVDVRGTGIAPTTLRYDGWQPPDWDLNTSDQGLTI